MFGDGRKTGKVRANKIERNKWQKESTKHSTNCRIFMTSFLLFTKLATFKPKLPEFSIIDTQRRYLIKKKNSISTFIQPKNIIRIWCICMQRYWKVFNFTKKWSHKIILLFGHAIWFWKVDLFKNFSANHVYVFVDIFVTCKPIYLYIH